MQVRVSPATSARRIAPSLLLASLLVAVGCSTDRGVEHRLGTMAIFSPPDGFVRVAYTSRETGARGAVFEDARTEEIGGIRLEAVPFDGGEGPGCARSAEDLARQLSKPTQPAQPTTLAGRPAVVTESRTERRHPSRRRLAVVRSYALFLDEDTVMRVELSAGSDEMLQRLVQSLDALELSGKALADADLTPRDASEAVAWLVSPRAARRSVGAACIPTFGAPAVNPVARAIRDRLVDPGTVSIWPLLARIGPTAVEELIELLADDSAAVRREAIKALADLGDERAHAPLAATIEAHPESAVDAIEALGALQVTTAVPQLIDILSDSDPDQRAAAAAALGRIGDARALPELMRVARTVLGTSREKAIRALGPVGGAEVLDELDGLVDDNDLEVRGNAILALSAIEDPRAVDLLCRAANHEHEQTRRSAARWLTTIDFDAARAALLACLDSPGPSARSSAAIGLGRLRADVSVRLSRLLDDEEPTVRNAAVRALAAVGDAPAIESLWAALVAGNDRAAAALTGLGKPAVSTLAAGLSHAEVAVRRSAVRALAGIDDPATLEPLLAALGDADDGVARTARQRLVNAGDTVFEPLLTKLRRGHPRERRQAALTLGSLGRTDALGPLTERLEDPDRRVRSAAVRALGDLRDPNAAVSLLPLLARDDLGDAVVNALSRLRPPVVPAIVAVLSTGSVIEQERAMRVLAELARRGEGPGLIDALIVGMGHDAATVRAVATAAAGDLGNPAAVDALLQRVEDAERAVRLRAIESLGALRAASAVDRLVALVAETDEALRRTAVVALGLAGDERVADALIGALSDTSDGVRRSAAEALGRLRSVQAAGPLRVALLDRRPAVRRAAATALGRIGEPGALAGLLAILADDADGQTRVAAAEALGLLGNATALPPLEIAAQDADPGVSEAARWALVQLTGELERWMTRR